MVLNCSRWFLNVLHGTKLYCMVLYCIWWYGLVWQGTVWHVMVRHGLAWNGVAWLGIRCLIWTIWSEWVSEWLSENVTTREAIASTNLSFVSIIFSEGHFIHGLLLSNSIKNFSNDTTGSFLVPIVLFCVGHSNSNSCDRVNTNKTFS